jgi:pimeloyl-ACP methyl ester carboxylesterase
MRRPIIRREIAALAALLALAASPAGAEPTKPEPTKPADPHATLRDALKVRGPEGIDTAAFVKIGGIQQWISVRGRNKDAPLLLFLHGGPGFTSIPSSWEYLTPWESYFLVAQWDQRGAGKTYGANPPEKIAPTLTLERMVDDAEEVAAHLRRTYHRRKIVLVGHDWGSVLGAMLARRHPDWFYAYVGMGQVVDTQRGEAIGYKATLAAARAADDGTAVRELEAMAPFPDPLHPERALRDLDKARHWLTRYGGYVRGAGLAADDDFAKLSPDATADELKAREAGLAFSLKALWAPLSRVSFWTAPRFGCPVVFFEGRHDLAAPSSLVADWFPRVVAPYKRLVWFPDAAHMVYEEEPAKVLVALVDDVLPLTGRR